MHQFLLFVHVQLSALHKYEDLLMKINAEAAHRLVPAVSATHKSSSLYRYVSYTSWKVLESTGFFP